MNYLIGDIQGCDRSLGDLLRALDFSPSRDHLFALGDLVNRGPESEQVLERLMALDGSATCLLGNHDLHLLAVDSGSRQTHRSDTLSAILTSSRRRQYIDWLRQRPLAVHAHGWLMVHAGVLPQWTLEQTLTLAGEVEAVLRSGSYRDFLKVMYANEPDRWDDTLTGDKRLRLVVNGLTRLRYCDANGTMDFKAKDGMAHAPSGLMPWFDAPDRRTQHTHIAFGHWSTLGLVTRPDLIALDTGCVWGGALTAAIVDDEGTLQGHLSLPCSEAQRPE